MKVIVTAEFWGYYKKGDVLEMHESTAKACISSGNVKAFSEGEPKSKPKSK